MNKTWQPKPKAEEALTAFPDLPSSIAQLLWNRGLKSGEEADSFLNPAYKKNLPDPFLFKDMTRAVERIGAAVKNGEKIVVHGDYDADGVCGAAILVSTLQKLGARVEVFLPHREMDGYGLNLDTVELLAADGVRLMITVDCGISNLKEIAAAKARQIDVVITDHHSIPKELPPAFAILHPKIEGESYPDKTLCGAGVAFKLAAALMKKLAPSADDWLAFEKKLLDLVAIASVADMVPLLGETRALVKFGLMVLNRAPRPGIKKMLDLARTRTAALTADDLAWKIAPRLNAAGRMNHANSAFELLVCEDAPEAEKLANLLEENNLSRRKSTEIMMKEAREIVTAQDLKSRSVIAVYKENWSAGLVGLIASRLKDAYGKPALVFSREGQKMVGSGRSVPGWNMVAAIQELPHFFEKFGGHPQACGFTLKTPELFDSFYDEIEKLAAARLTGEEEQVLEIEAVQPLEAINWDLFSYLEKLEPFGMGNPRPRFLSKNAAVYASRVLGSDKKHLKLILKDENGKIHQAIGFGLAEKHPRLISGEKIDLVYEVDANEWNGQRELQIKIVDLKICN